MNLVHQTGFASITPYNLSMTHSLPNEAQRKALCELMHHAFVELRYLEGAQAHELAYAFHNLPVEIYGWGGWSPDGTRRRLQYYQSKHEKNLGVNYVEIFNRIFPENESSNH